MNNYYKTKFFSIFLLVCTVTLVSLTGNSQTTNTESFDGTTFVPTGWTNLLVSGTNTWTRVTSGTSPTQAPHTGVGEAKFNSYSASGGVRALITPAYDLSSVGANTATVSFWMYRDNGYATDADKIDVYMNTAANLTSAALLGTVNRSTTLAPVEAANGWYQYTFNVPGSFNTNTNYLILQGTSAFGNNIFIDDVTWISYPPVCSGTPNPGNTVSSSSSICSGTSFALSLENPTFGSGVTYQWQSSTNGTNYSNIVGATNASLNTAQTAATYYQCIVTCSNSSTSTTSTSVQVTMNSFLNCYCTLSATASGDTDLGNVTIGTLNNGVATPVLNNSTATGTYTNYSTADTTDLSMGVNTPISLSQITSGATFYQAWFNVFIDYNQNGVFDLPAERAFTSTQLTTEALATQTGFVNVPTSAIPGITKMRVRISEGGSTADPACGTFSYGEVEDYLVNIVCPDLTNLETHGISICSNNSATLTAVPFSNVSTLTWYSASTGGSVLATNDTLITPSLLNTTSYWVEESLNGCPASGRIEVVATVDPVNVTLNPIDAICNGSSTGTFQLGTVNCGSAPFTYSVDGSAFGQIPSNLAAGNHTVVVKGAGAQLSAEMTITIGEPTLTISNPIGIDTIVCVNASSAVISASSVLSTYSDSTQIIYFNVLNQPIDTNINPGAIFTTGTMAALPAGAIVTNVLLNYNGIEAVGSSWQSDVNISSSGAVHSNANSSDSTNGMQGIFNYFYTINNDSVDVNGGTIDLYYYDVINDNASSAESIFPTGDSVVTITIQYSYPTPSTINWYSAISGGSQIGTGNSLEAVGTSVLANTELPGVYNFYVEGENGGCTSPSRTLVTVTVDSPTDTLVVQACETYTAADNSVYTTSGLYHYYVTNVSGCDSTIFIDLTVFHAVFAANASVSNVNVLTTTTPGTSFQWINCSTGNSIIPGATSVTYTATANGSYAVIVTQGTCGIDTSDCVAVTNLSLTELNLVSNSKVSPNPTKDFINVVVNGNEDANIVLYDIQGKVILEKSKFKSNDVISLQNLEMGIYTLRVSTSEGITVHRIVKN
ncbi:MAG: T9SS type A sorting domain-containing protein [Flavobacteriia bacterium]|nr:T9SS type A sorting domain-containing protein [Flavobacteriia bacterium]